MITVVLVGKSSQAADTRLCVFRPTMTNLQSRDALLIGIERFAAMTVEFVLAASAIVIAIDLTKFRE